MCPYKSSFSRNLIMFKFFVESIIEHVHSYSHVNGLWAIKVDRLSDLDVFMVREAKKGVYSRIGRIRLSRAIVDQRIVWDLHLDELAPRKA